MSGRSLMNLRSTTWPVVASSVAMVCVWAVTSIFCAVLATFSVRFAVGFSLTFNLMWVRTVFSNPCISAVTEYNPGGIETDRYPPRYPTWS